MMSQIYDYKALKSLPASYYTTLATSLVHVFVLGYICMIPITEWWARTLVGFLRLAIILFYIYQELVFQTSPSFLIPLAIYILIVVWLTTPFFRDVKHGTNKWTPFTVVESIEDYKKNRYLHHNRPFKRTLVGTVIFVGLFLIALTVPLLPTSDPNKTLFQGKGRTVDAIVFDIFKLLSMAGTVWQLLVPIPEKRLRYAFGVCYVGLSFICAISTIFYYYRNMMELKKESMWVLLLVGRFGLIVSQILINLVMFTDCDHPFNQITPFRVVDENGSKDKGNNLSDLNDEFDGNFIA